MPGVRLLRRAVAGIRRVGQDLLFLAAGMATAAWLLVLTVYTAVAVLSMMWLLGAVLVLLLMPLLAGTVWWERQRLRLVVDEVPLARQRPPRPTGLLARVTNTMLTSVNSAEVGYLLLLAPVAILSGALCLGLWLTAIVNLVDPIVDSRAGGWAIAALACAAAVVLARWCRGLQVRLAVTMLARALDSGRSQLRVHQLRVMDAQAAELRRLESDLHDGAQARLVALNMQLGLLTRTLRDAVPAADPARAQAAAATESAQEALRELRHLVRGLHPPILTDRGLTAALHTLAADNPVPTQLRVEVPDRLSPAVESAVYFVVAESLTNVAKHSHATTCLGEVRANGPTIFISIKDEGCGGADSAGRGISGLSQRVAALDGWLSLSSPVGGPTVMRVDLPCA